MAISNPPDITERIPSVISARRQVATFANSTIRYGVSIAGLPFLLEPSEQMPQQRQTADWRKQQFDADREAGEQTLDSGSVWTRSEASYHRGAGIKFYEPGADDLTEFRFDTSAGVDVWTKGEVSLLHRMDKLSTVSSGTTSVVGAVIGGADVYFANSNGTLSRGTGSGSPTAYTGSTALLGRPAVAGGTVLVGHATDIWKGSSSGSTVAAMGLTGVSGGIRPYWVKSRIVATSGAKVHSFPLSQAAGAIPAAIYAHPDSAWTWSDVAETTDAILLAGYSAGSGALFAITLEDDGSGNVVLGAPHQIAEFPPGEYPTAIKVYLGTYIAIGTNQGLRVGVITGQTSVSPTVIQYGPLLFETDFPVTSLAARDSFIYAGVQNGIDGSSGVFRVNLEAQIGQNSLRWPYASDVQVHTTGPVDGIAFLGASERVVLGVSSSGVWLQSADHYEPTGYLTSGSIRYATTEPKQFWTSRLRANYSANGGIALTTVAPTGQEAFIVRLDRTSSTSDDISITRPEGLWEYLAFRLTFDSNNADGTPNGTSTPVMTSFAVKALPAPRKQRLVTYPVRLRDRVEDAFGNKFGGDGYASKARRALEDLEDSSAVIPIRDTEGNESYLGVIDKLMFTRTIPRTKASPSEEWNAMITVRKLAT